MGGHCAWHIAVQYPDRCLGLMSYWSYEVNTISVLIGHSMGGHGAWHIAVQYPDRCLGLMSYLELCNNTQSLY